jgi:hypothetical protein
VCGHTRTLRSDAAGSRCHVARAADPQALTRCSIGKPRERLTRTERESGAVMVTALAALSGRVPAIGQTLGQLDKVAMRSNHGHDVGDEYSARSDLGTRNAWP